MKKINSFFTTYEKIWFVSVLALAVATSLLFPEESLNGIKGSVLTGLYLLDTFLNILCELLISKQSRWNFIVSLGVELTEIIICLLLAYRIATMASTIFFWIPIDIISFVNWNKHKDSEDDELTEVRRLNGKQEVLVLLGIAVWTVAAGYLTCVITEDFVISDFFGANRNLEMITCYLDACVSALGIANGIFIWLRFREQWIAWYAYAILEIVINVIAIISGHPGQAVLLVLKLGYLTNTTYGYMRWTRYIKSKEKLEK